MNYDNKFNEILNNYFKINISPTRNYTKEEYKKLDDKYKIPNYFHPDKIIRDDINNYLGKDKFMDEAFKYLELKN